MSSLFLLSCLWLTLSYLLRQASMSSLPSLIYLGSVSKQLLTEVSLSYQVFVRRILSKRDNFRNSRGTSDSKFIKKEEKKNFSKKKMEKVIFGRSWSLMQQLQTRSRQRRILFGSSRGQKCPQRIPTSSDQTFGFPAKFEIKSVGAKKKKVYE